MGRVVVPHLEEDEPVNPGTEDSPSRVPPPAAEVEHPPKSIWGRQAFVLPGSSSWILPAGLLLVLGVYLAHALYFRQYINDDAYITFRYSRFLAVGRGPYYNIGEHVEGYTNFLLMLLIAPVIAIFGQGAAAPVAKGIGLVCGALSLVAVYLLCRRLGQSKTGTSIDPGFAGLLAVGLVAVSPSYALNSMSGLETTLFGFLLLAGVLLGITAPNQGRWQGAGVAFSLAALARPEGVLFFGVYWIAMALLRRLKSARNTTSSYLIRDGVIVAVVFAGHLLFRFLAYDGEWLPNTFYAKAGGFTAQKSWPYVRWGLIFPFGGIIPLLAAGVGCALAGGMRRTAIPLLAVAVTGGLLPFFLGTDWMLGYRALMPYLPCFAVLVALGWIRLAGAIVRGRRAPGLVLLVIALPMMWLHEQEFRTLLHDHITTRSRGYKNGHMAMANWLRSEEARPGDTIALMDIGIVGYLCTEQRILDVTGLTDRYIAKCPGIFLDKQYDLSYVLDQKPRFIVIVLTMPGGPDVVPERLTLIPGTGSDSRLMQSPDFVRWYRRPTSEGPPGEPWLQTVARTVGAERVFQHAHPGCYYLLAVYRRADEA
jgi:arabinofuranosyltransferase